MPQFFNAWAAYNWLESILLAALTAACVVLWHIARVKIRKVIANSNTAWDDIILHALDFPLLLIILATGGTHIAGSVFDALMETPAAAAAADFTLATGAAGAGGGGGSVEGFIVNLRAVAILIAFFWALLRLINRAELYYRQRRIKIGEREINPGTLYAAFQTARALVFVIALLTAMEGFGLSVSGLLAFGGIGGILIGFAAKDTLSNFFSGMLIFWERPFVVGDWIRCPDANIEGVVEDIGWRMTQVRTFDQRPLYVPNSLFFNSVIENPQRMTNRRIYEYMGVRYEDIGKLPALLADIRAMVDAHDGIAKDKIRMVNFDRYNASSLDFFVYAMTRTTDWAHFHQVKEDILIKIAALVKKHGCDFAFPTRTLHHQNFAPPAEDIGAAGAGGAAGTPAARP